MVSGCKLRNPVSASRLVRYEILEGEGVAVGDDGVITGISTGSVQIRVESA